MRIKKDGAQGIKLMAILISIMAALFALEGCAIRTGQPTVMTEQPSRATPTVNVSLAAEDNNSSEAPSLPETKQENSTPPLRTIARNTTAAQERLIKGKSLKERLQQTYDELHTYGSGESIRSYFPDIENVYTDTGEGRGFPSFILPFRYYYSEEANTTFNICNIDFTVFICKGKLDREINDMDILSGRCELTQVYRDSQGGSGFARRR